VRLGVTQGHDEVVHAHVPVLLEDQAGEHHLCVCVCYFLLVVLVCVGMMG
jgi:hypothetical protein